MSYPRKKYILAIIVLVGIIIIPAIIAGVSGYLTLKTAKYGMITMFLLGFFMYPLIMKLVDWIDSKMDPIMKQKKKDAHDGRLGYEGEDIVNGWLEEIVGKGNVSRNVPFISTSGHKFDIDLVTVGSKGAVAIEVKNLTYPRYFEGDDYFQIKNNKKISLPPDDDPRFEANRHAFALREWLSVNGFEKVKITKIVAFANGRVSWEGKPGIYIAKDKESLRQCIDSLEDDPNCVPEVCEEIKSLLAKK